MLVDRSMAPSVIRVLGTTGTRHSPGSCSRPGTCSCDLEGASIRVTFVPAMNRDAPAFNKPLPFRRSVPFCLASGSSAISSAQAAADETLPWNARSAVARPCICLDRTLSGTTATCLTMLRRVLRLLQTPHRPHLALETAGTAAPKLASRRWAPPNLDRFRGTSGAIHRAPGGRGF